MGKKLVIVESPSKAKTIKKYLGSEFEVIASQGHIIDLPASRMGVDIENNFKPEYIKMKGKAKLIKQIKDEAVGKEKVLLATDPDREGEAIAWHLKNELKLKDSDKCRIEFNEITENAVKQATNKPRAINMDTVNAQQARRILDRLVGYKLSPILWKKVKTGLSAGRVQSVALRIIVDKENEIREFVKQEYWALDALLRKDGEAKLVNAKFYGTKEGKKAELNNEQDTMKVVNCIKGKDYTVSSVVTTEKKKSPPPPFTTSSLQQDASRKLSFSVKKTMSVAQKLYEAGYITYMRTDSVRVSDDAIKMAKAYICKEYSEKYYLNRNYKSKQNAQDAHEAIRPTHLFDLKETTAKMDKDEAKLYTLIFNRFVASRMESCVYDSTKATFIVDDYMFNATGSVIKFKGYMALYIESQDDDDVSETDEKELPKLNVGDILHEEKLHYEQKYTEPPARYTEASLVKYMEEKGIGRPSTYAPTISTILDRLYVEKEGKYLLPTELGEVVNKIMVEHFKNIVDILFTADMEKKLDNIESGKQEYTQMLKDFYLPFIKNLEQVEGKIERVKLTEKISDVPCEICGKMLVIKHGRFGDFLACPGYPECKNTKPIVNLIKETCPKCGGKVLIRKTKSKRNFYVCENNTNNESKTCDYISWNKPGSETKTTYSRKTNAKKAPTTKKKTATKKKTKK